MNSKERVHAALRREPVDRVPIWMWFHPETIQRLSIELEIPPAKVAEALGDDIRQAWVGNNYAMEGIVHPHEGDSHLDNWGIRWVKVGPFNQIASSPLALADDEQIRHYRYPYAETDRLLRNMQPVMANKETHFVGCDISPCLFEMVCRVRGMEAILVDLAEGPDRARILLQQAGDFSLHLARRTCDQLAIDWLWTGDDVGGQQSMIMSPAKWREMIKPLLAKIFAVGKAHGLWVAYHSCGSIGPIIPDLIEIGLDVLNPIQCNCPGMEPIQLKKEFGNQLSFFGGIDTQDLLPNGNAAQVFRETANLIQVMTSDGGGYILGASHAVPPETPLENIFAVYQAAGVSREEIFDRSAAIRGRG